MEMCSRVDCMRAGERKGGSCGGCGESGGQMLEPAESRVGESLLGGSATTLEKRACRLTKRRSMSKFHGSLEGCREASENAFLLNDFNKIYEK